MICKQIIFSVIIVQMGHHFQKEFKGDVEKLMAAQDKT
jgi:hypothetical protein